MANAFETVFNLPLPQCCSQGDCCKGASPSVPWHRLLERAANGDDFAQGFFSIMVPYPSHEAARQVVPGLVEKSYEACRKDAEFPNNEADLVFYHCRYLQADNRCGVHEDRPQFCRDYPDSPYVVMAPGCAFEPWAAACKTKMQAMTDELDTLKALKAELEATMSTQRAEQVHAEAMAHVQLTVAEELSLMLSITPLYLSSPLQSWVSYRG